MIIALAGRRIDAPDAEDRRFPPENTDMVRLRLRELFRANRATALVSSAACGADLLALSEAGAAGMRLRVVLPFDRRKFRASSVTDRPGDWGALFDRTTNELDAAGDLVVLPGDSEGDQAFAAVNHAIFDEAARLASGAGNEAIPTTTSVVVWEGSSRGPDDLTEAFREEAVKRGLPVLEVLTL